LASKAMPEKDGTLTYLEQVLKELDTKIDQLDTGIRLGQVPSRQDLEKFTWKTGRVVRMLVKPEKSEDRKMFWSECKGILKKVLVIENFNPGVFQSSAVRQDIIETDLLACLQLFKKYTKDRSEGKVAKPDEQLEAVHIAKKAKKALEDEKAAEEAKKAEEEGWGGKGKGKGKGKKKGKNKAVDDGGVWGELGDKWDMLMERKGRWDDGDSDPDEPCPDVEKFGKCSFGRQCGFCHRT